MNLFFFVVLILFYQEEDACPAIYDSIGASPGVLGASNNRQWPVYVPYPDMVSDLKCPRETACGVTKRDKVPCAEGLSQQ